MPLETPKLMSLRQAVALRRRWAAAGGTCVLTNGVFDLLHPGHTSYLAKARRMAGNRGGLVVALNSDASVRSLKGPARPILDERSRAFNLAQLESVDAVVIFRRRRLDREIAALKPDVYCKAGDYTRRTLDASERTALDKAGARIRFLPFVKGFSTTRMIERIRAAGSC